MNNKLLSLLCVCLLGSLTALSGCSDDGTTVVEGNTCGEGTEESGGQCVPIAGTSNGTGGLTCGAGTIEAGGVCVPSSTSNGTSNGTGATCGAGTIEMNGECLPDPNAVIDCGDGTIEMGGECVPDPDAVIECGDGTIEMGGECVPDPDAAIECGEGTVPSDDGTECVPAQNPEDFCGEGTILIDDECVIIDPLADATVTEGPEPNDNVINRDEEGTPTEVMLPAVGETLIARGTINEPEVLDLGGGEQLIPDLDTWAMSLNKGARLRIEATGVGAPQVAAFIEYEITDAGDDAPVVQRVALAFNDSNAAREIVAPVSGVYNITVGYQPDLLDVFGLTNPFFGPLGEPQGDDKYTYLLAVTPLENPAPAQEDNAAFTWTGDLAEVPQALIDAPANTLLDIDFEVNGAPGVNGLYWLATSDYDQYIGAFAGGRHVVPDGGLLVTADNLWVFGADSTFSMNVVPVPAEVVEDDFEVGSSVEADDVNVGLGGDYNYVMNVTEAQVIEVSAVASVDSFANPAVVVLDSEYQPLGVGANADADGVRSVTVALLEPGTYFVSVVDISGLTDPDVGYTADIDITSIAGIDVLTANAPLDSANASVSGTTSGELADADGAAYFAFTTAELGSLLATGSPLDNLDLGIEMYLTPQLGEGGAFAPDITIDEGESCSDICIDVNDMACNEGDVDCTCVETCVNVGEDEVFEAPLFFESTVIVRLVNVGETAADMNDATFTVDMTFGIIEEMEPNQDDTEATDLGSLTADPVVGLATLTLGEQEEVVDYWSFTLDFSAIVTATTFPAQGNNGVDTTLTIFNAAGEELAFNDDYQGADLTSQAVSILGAGTYYVAVDGFQSNEQGPYTLGVQAEPLPGDDSFDGDSMYQDDAIELGLDENFNANLELLVFEITEPMILKATARPAGGNGNGGGSLSEPFILVGNSALQVIGASNDAPIDGDYSVTVAIHEPGTYFVQVEETGFAAGVQLAELIVEPVADLVQLGDTLSSGNSSATATNSDLFTADSDTFYWVDVMGFGDLSITGTPMTNLDVELEAFFGQELADASGYNPDIASNAGIEGEVEMIEITAGGVLYLRAVNIGIDAADNFDLDLDASLIVPANIIDELEPNDDISLATPIGALEDDITYARGILEPGVPNENGFPGPTADTFSFDVENLAEVTISVLGIGNNDPFDVTLLDRSQNNLGGVFGNTFTEILDPGTYFVEVDFAVASEMTEYRIEIAKRDLACRPGQQQCADADVQICNEDGSELITFTCALTCEVVDDVAGCEAALEEEDNNTSDIAQDLGAIESGSLFALEGEIDSSADARDDDWFSFTIAADSVVTLETKPSAMGGPNFDSEIWLYNADNPDTALANDDDAGVANYSKIGPQFLEAGTYLVRVEYFSTFTDGAGLYRLEILVQAPNCDFGSTVCDEANITLCNGLEFETISTCSVGCDDSGDDAICTDLPTPTDMGSFPAGLPGNWPGEVLDTDATNWYTFEVTEDWLINIALTTADTLDFETIICDWEQFSTEQCDAGNNILDGGADIGGLMPAGVYYLAVLTGDGVGGTYDIDATGVMPDGDDTPDTATEATLPFNSTDAMIDYVGDADWYTFTLDADLTVDIFAISTIDPVIDTRITLCNETQVAAGTCIFGFLGDSIATGDQGFEGELDIISDEPLTAGTYYVLVEAWGPNAFQPGEGDYALTIQEDDGL